MTKVWNFVFGCHHRRLSWVFRSRARYYRVCLECGKEFDYHGPLK